jgi:hypothetical protein
MTLVSFVFTSGFIISCVSLLQNGAILDSMTVLEAVSALERQQSRANDLGIRVCSLPGKVSSIGLSSISANLAEGLSTIGIGVGGVIELLVVKLS